jgi:hypothetical protein
MIAPGCATRSARWLAASGVVGCGRRQPASSRRGLFFERNRQSVRPLHAATAETEGVISCESLQLIASSRAEYLTVTNEQSRSADWPTSVGRSGLIRTDVSATRCDASTQVRCDTSRTREPTRGELTPNASPRRFSSSSVFRPELDAMIRHLETHLGGIDGRGRRCVSWAKWTVLTSPRLHALIVAAEGEPHRWNLGTPRHCQSSSSQPAAAREPGNDGCQVVRVDGLWHVDLEPSQQRQVCVVLLDERG